MHSLKGFCKKHNFFILKCLSPVFEFFLLLWGDLFNINKELILDL